MDAYQIDLHTASDKASKLSNRVDSMRVGVQALAAELAQLQTTLAKCLLHNAAQEADKAALQVEAEDRESKLEEVEQARLASTLAQQEAERKLQVMTSRAVFREKQHQTQRRLKDESITMLVKSQLSLANTQSLLEDLRNDGAQSKLEYEAKLTQQERTFEQTIRKLSSRLKVEEEQFARTSGHLRLDLAEKDNQLKAERERRHAAELAVVNLQALLDSLQETSSKAADSYHQEVNKATLKLNKALAEKQALSDEHAEVKGSLRAEAVAKEVATRKLERVSSNLGDSITAKVEELTRSLAKEVAQAKRERADMQSAKAAVAAQFNKEKMKAKNLEAAVTTLKKEKEVQAAKHKAEVNRLRDDVHVLRAKQATPPVESKQPKSKAAKKKALTLQASASINANDTLAEGSPAQVNSMSSIITSTSNEISACWATDEAVPDSPGPSVAPPSPDSTGRRGVPWGSHDDEDAVASSSGWAVRGEEEWQTVLRKTPNPRPTRARSSNRGSSRVHPGHRRHQHRA